MIECEKIIAQYDEYFRQLNEGYENDLKNIVPTERFKWVANNHLGDTWTKLEFASFDTSQSAIDFMMKEDYWNPEYECTVISDTEFMMLMDDECITYKRCKYLEELWFIQFQRTVSHEIDLELLGQLRTAALTEGECLG